MRWRLALAALLWPGLAAAADPPPPAVADEDGLSPFPTAATEPAKDEPTTFSFRRMTGFKDLSTKLDVSGYLQPSFQFVHIDTALPRDKTQYGLRGTRMGFAIYGTPLERFTYVANIVLAPAGVEEVVLLSPSATSTVGFSISSATQTAVYIEELSLAYRATDFLQIKAGLVHMPFSVGQTTPIPEQLTPFRPPVTGEFQSGDDASVLGIFRLFDGKLFLNASTFLGTSLGGFNANQTVRGPSFLVSVAAHPLGEMEQRELDTEKGPFRFAFGVGGIYRRATAFDPTGYEASKFDDFRLAAWVRAQWHGLHLQGEYLRRNRTDDLSGRPDRSEGEYGQLTYFQPITKKVAFGPLARVSTLKTLADFAPRRFTAVEAGLAFYPRADQAEPERLRLLLEYYYAHTSPLSETQHEALVQMQLEF